MTYIGNHTQRHTHRHKHKHTRLPKPPPFNPLLSRPTISELLRPFSTLAPIKKWFTMDYSITLCKYFMCFFFQISTLLKFIPLSSYSIPVVLLRSVLICPDLTYTDYTQVTHFHILSVLHLFFLFIIQLKAIAVLYTTMMSISILQVVSCGVKMWKEILNNANVLHSKRSVLLKSVMGISQQNKSDASPMTPN